MAADIRIRPFEAADVEKALELSDAAGWNQVVSDWQRIIDVEPEGCLGAWADDRLVGTTTFVTYDEHLAWIGMVLVHPEYRRKGIGRHLFQTIMSDLHERGIEEIGLDATDSGRPLYLSEGFVDVAPIVRWQGTLRPTGNGSDAATVRQAGADDVPAVASFDYSTTRIDRRPLLDHLYEEEYVTCFISEALDGYAFVRPGRRAWQIGPLVAQSQAAASALLNAAAMKLEGREVVVDSPREETADLLESAGLHPRRHLMRMTYGRVCRLLTNQYMLAATSFAWG